MANLSSFSNVVDNEAVIPGVGGHSGKYLSTDGSTMSWAEVEQGGGLTFVAKTANHTTSSGEGILANTSGGAFTVTLPASPSTGDQVVIADSGSSFATNNLTVSRNSSTIDGVAEDLLLDVDDVLVDLIYDGSTWQFYVSLRALTTTETSSGGSSVTAYTNFAAFPSSGNTAGDMGFAEDTKALYIWDGAEWDRVYSGPNESLDWVVEPNSSYSLAADGTATTATIEATDPEGFDVTYDYATSPSNQTQATIVNNNDGTFTITPSTSSADEGSFVMRFSASDGLHVVAKSSTFSLAFSTDITFASGAQTSAFTGTVDNSWSRSPYDSTADNSLKSGRWYIESSLITAGGSSFHGGIADATLNMSYTSTSQASIYGNGNIYYGGAITTSLGTLTAGDVIGICVDTSTREVWFARNNTWYQDPSTSSSIVIDGTGDLYYGFLSGTSSSPVSATLHIGVNSGSRVYSPPSGFTAY